MLLFEDSLNEVFDIQEGRFPLQNKTPKPKHQPFSKSRKSFLEQIILDFFCAKQTILSQTFFIAIMALINLTGKFDTCLKTQLVLQLQWNSMY